MVEPNAQDDKLVKINENLLDDLNVVSFEDVRFIFSFTFCLIQYHSTDDYFDAIFDILNDDDDGGSGAGADDNHNTAEELENINEEYYQNYDFDYINTNVDEEEMMPEDDTIVDDNDDHKVNNDLKCTEKETYFFLMIYF
jgi:hypothetical protein